MRPSRTERVELLHAGDKVLHALLIFSHPFWAAFYVLPLRIFSIGQNVVSRLDPGHIVHISEVHQQLLLILEDGEPARLYFAAHVHATLDPHVPGHVGVGVACDGLSEVSTKEGHLINRESCQHSPYIRQPPPVPIVVVRYHPWQHGAQRADVLVPVANVDCVHILHQRVRLGQEVPSVVRHITGLRLGEDVDDEALEVTILLQCRMGCKMGFLGETRISQNLDVLAFSNPASIALIPKGAHF